nr:hypothetical protein BaRGS_012272 [Batillaria attramentaria]
MDEEDSGNRQVLLASAAAPTEDFNTVAISNGLGAIGQVALILANGSLEILNLADSKVIAQLTPSDGIERLCLCTSGGKLKFYQVSQQQLTESGQSSTPTEAATSRGPTAQDMVDGKKGSTEDDTADMASSKIPVGGDYLANGPLVSREPAGTTQPAQFENLMPRFTATVPPCWSEIQQEQQQRRHPQHLQQQGEATQHTRTWKLTQNGSTWDDHLFEIVLPKPCCVGHVDVKFTLHPLCTTAPNIEVTLLKQNIGSMGRHMQASTTTKSKTLQGDSADVKENMNYVQDPAFLEKNNAEILCGPMKLGSCLDLSGGGGLASLSSPKLLNSKPRSLLLHIKGFKNKAEDSADGAQKGASAGSEDRSEKAQETRKKIQVEHKTIKCLFENVSNAGASAVERLAASAPKQKLTDIKGCDWLAEISVTVRKFKRTPVARERQQRNAMLENTGFHEKLLCVVISPPTDLQGMNAEHFQNLALDILLWIAAVQMNDPSKRSGVRCLVVTIQPYLQDIIKACFIDASRTTAHKCARLLALCIEYAKLSEDQDLAPAFSFHLLQALIECLPLLVGCSSAGSMKWFFTVLNRVKCMDASLVARSATDLLNAVSAQYHRNFSPLHALLKTRYGLYGNPFDVDMFDMDLPHNLRQPPAPPSSYASATAKSTSTFGGPSTSSAIPTVGLSATASSSQSAQSREEPDLFEMLNTPLEKTGCTQVEFLRSHVLGLLEVEPLTFTCHATSDGTRVERMDAATSVPTSGTGPTLTATAMPLSMGTINFDDPPPSLLQPGGGGVVVGGGSGGGGVMGGGTSGLAMADSLKKLAQMYAKQLHPGYKQIHQLISARRFVTLDFGKAVVLTDVVIPACGDLASLSIDVWVQGEEIDGQRLVVAADIGSRTLFVTAHVKYYLKRGQRRADEDAAIVQSYNECLQLQLQLNLAQRAITRLQRAMGVKSGGYDENIPFSHRLQQTPTDKLRVIVEGLLDTLLTLTVASPAVPQPPHPLYLAFPPPTAEDLFRHLCLLGSRRTQVHAGLLLSRVCGSQSWWGVFLGNVLREFFHSEYSVVFPQDRVFVLLSALSQKALTGPSCVRILDSLLAMLTGVLQPLVAAQSSSADAAGCLDLGLVSWILLFLCRNFESALTSSGSEDSDKGAKREKEGAGTGGGKSKSRKLYSRSMQKRILHHKQKLHDIEAAKSMLEKAKDKLSTQVGQVVFKEAAGGKDSKALLKEQEALLKKELAQFRSKHFKDMIYMRRNDLEYLRKLPKEDSGAGGGKDTEDEPTEPLLVLPRERCLLVVRGLMSLLLSMDFSCHVDLFLVACKVLAKICVATRPALTLAEVMSQEQLERLILLAVQHDNSGPSVWGGPWASHAITCLLQDILEGEKLYPNSMTSSEEDLLASETAETDEQLAQSGTSINTDDGTDDDIDSLAEGGAEGGLEPPTLDKDASMMMDLLLDEVELEDDSLDSLVAMDMQPGPIPLPPPPPSYTSKVFAPNLPAAFAAFPKPPMGKKKLPGMGFQQNGQMDPMLGPSSLFHINPAADDFKFKTSTASSVDKKTDQFKKLKTKLNDLISTKAAASSHGLSVAQDARLEFGLQWLPELRLRLPHMLSEPAVAPMTSTPTDDELSQATQAGQSMLSSSAMLSQCFDHLFAQLSHGRVSLDSVLQLWLTLNQSSTSSSSHEDQTPMAFVPSRVPIVPLGPRAVVHLMEAVMATPVISVRSWVFVLHTLCLLANQRLDAAPSAAEEEAATGGRDMGPASDGVGTSSMASVVLTDSNLVPFIIKFLSGSSANSPSSSGLQFYQSVDVNGQNLKEILLKIVYQLTAERGAISSCTGPLDAQCKFVETVAGVTFDSVDLSNAISVVASISALVHQHIRCQDPVLCASSHDASISARSCFSGLFASLLRGGEPRGSGGEASRDQLMCSLLRLVNKLVQVPLPGTSPRPNPPTDGAGRDQMELQEGMSDAAKLNWAFNSLSMQSSAVPTSPMSDDEKRQQTTSGNVSGAGGGGGGGSDPSDSTDTVTGERYVADIILGNPHVMQSLVQALSYCSSNKMALILGSAPAASAAAPGNDNFNMADPLSVGDGIYQILCTLLVRATNCNAMTESLFHYLAGNYPHLDSSALCRLSEPLLKFLLRVLDNAAAIRHFVELGGVQVVCTSLVRSSRQFISVGPSMISTIMQNMTSVAAAAAEEKAKAADSDNVEGLFNFAPLGENL